MTRAATTNYGGSFETCAYSADGLRQRKVNASGGTNFHWEQNNIVVETDQSSVSRGRYTYGPGRRGQFISVDRMTDYPTSRQTDAVCSVA